MDQQQCAIWRECDPMMALLCSTDMCVHVFVSMLGIISLGISTAHEYNPDWLFVGFDVLRSVHDEAGEARYTHG